MIDFNKYHLKDNPFRISPVIDSQDIIWAGMEDLKKRIDARIMVGINTSPSRIVLNWGRYGSGKTHAANFYTRTDYISTKFQSITKNIKVTLPRSPKDPVQAFLRALVGQMNFDNIINDFKEFYKSNGEQSTKIIDAFTQDSIIAQLLKIFLGISPKDTTLFPGISFLPNDVLKNYLYGDKSKETLSQLGLPLGLEDDEQVVNLISGIFNTITYNKNLYKCIFLWIDEFEDIDNLPKSSQDRLTTFLRQLIDKTPNNLIVFLNFTLKGSGNLEDLSIILGEALMSRTKLYIDFDSPNSEEALNYIIELINNPRFRDEKDIASNKLYPFTKAAIDKILLSIGNLTIRKINETLSLILELALLEEKTPKEIDLVFVDKIKDEIPSWKK